MAESTKVAWVTGSSTGIGRATALKLAERGYDVVVHYTRSEDKAEEVAGRIESSGRDALLVRGDVSRAEDVRRMVCEIDGRYGRVDVLVNNVGSFIERASLDGMTEELWDRTVDVNLKSVYLCSRSVLPLMRRHGGGKIINISSIAAWEGGGSIAYAAAKGGVDSLTRAMARELASEGILVNAVSPGRVDTPFHDKFTALERRKEKEKAIPLKREGTAEEIGAVVAFLASSEASYVLGEVIEVNGGQRMG
ncbi:MAG: 3-oxoacyl-ACP reductase FabG [Actinomycetota bacterium]|nr:3-oxoacyl-ACP reductase FabG [Actinomycetota bacterium]